MKIITNVKEFYEEKLLNSTKDICSLKTSKAKKIKLILVQKDSIL